MHHLLAISFVGFILTIIGLAMVWAGDRFDKDSLFEKGAYIAAAGFGVWQLLGILHLLLFVFTN